ncbi:hypothetical protein [Maribacter polysaccharolyticus]|uniref:hypothetical protein n=1 Tax=Maribacter polysaccharolyticus TaxID=3020831 RepID=UPI00237F5811|nr:hypothetical protein [Maribacter polysaccharolyticus]MDE3740288.1 hypothetical protein [Maribacter polysaccharolyticus]
MKIKWYKLVVGALVIFLGVFFLFAIWYKYEYAMEMAEVYEINTPQLNKRLLIATQGSDFKNSVSKGVIDHYRTDSVYIKVIDVSSIMEVSFEDYDAILILHTWEYNQAPEAVTTFLENAGSFKNKTVILTTSGEGSETMEGVDALTGESRLEDAPKSIERILARLDPLLYF